MVLSTKWLNRGSTPLFERDTEIYRDRDALREDYQPEKLVGRDEELRIFQAVLQLAIDDEQPNNIFLYGKTGIGKAAASWYLLGYLRKGASHYDDIHPTVVFLNCDGLASLYQTATRPVNKFRPESNQISTMGYPLGSVYEMLWQEFGDCDGTIIIVLDEIDHVNDDSIFYQLSRARVNGNLDAAKVGFIGISNDLSLRDNLPPKVKSSLCEQEIRFPTYNAKNLRVILERRTKVTFREGVFSGEVIPLCAVYGAKDAGNARQSIDLLMKAGDLAHDDDTDRIEEEHVKRGRRALEYGRIKEGINGLTEHSHLALYSLLTLELEDETPICSRDVRSCYTWFIELANRDPFVLRWTCDHLSELAMLGIVSVTERNEGRRGGTYREYVFDTDAGLIVSAIRDTIKLVGVHKTAEPFLDGNKTSTFDDFIEQ